MKLRPRKSPPQDVFKCRPLNVVFQTDSRPQICVSHSTQRVSFLPGSFLQRAYSHVPIRL